MLPLAEDAYNTSTHSSTDSSLVQLDLEYAQCIPLHSVVGQQQHDEMLSLQGVVINKSLQPIVLDDQHHLSKLQDILMAQANRTPRPCTFEV